MPSDCYNVRLSKETKKQTTKQIKNNAAKTTKTKQPKQQNQQKK